MVEALEPYYLFALRAIAREGTYRFEVFTSIASLVVRVYLLRVVWVALYARNAAPHGVPLHSIITYSAVALLMGLVLDIDQTKLLHDKLHDGSIVVDMMKPISVPFYLFADGTGEVMFHASLIVPSLALALLVVHIDVPSAAVLGAFALSFFLAYFVGFFLNFMLNCIAFWTLEITAVQLIVTWITDLLGGQIVPLLFFPAVVQQAVFALPFAAMFSTPLLIYIGRIPPERYAEVMALQVLWIVVLAAVSTVMWRAGTRRVVVQGG
ncbi:MAG TPA: ABC-2 family transporter protein [Candidatus Lustribacter sp.]|jgi:ABC-2 type transport system permease protein|nr:ABC-2 family transporter protein [Candidatus Lustribacter sp.]